MLVVVGHESVGDEMILLGVVEAMMLLVVQWWVEDEAEMKLMLASSKINGCSDVSPGKP